MGNTTGPTVMCIKGATTALKPLTTNWDRGIVIKLIFLPAEDLRQHQGSEDIKREPGARAFITLKLFSNCILFEGMTESKNELC